VIRAVVVVPAHNEEQLIGACVAALENQVGIARAEYEVIVVLDRCTDATAENALKAGDVRLIRSRGAGVGHARRTGMDLAATLLDPLGLIATTDADSTPAPDWLITQLEAIDGGAQAIGGRVEVGAHDLPPQALQRRAQDAPRRLRAIAGAGRKEHHQFSGASIGVTAATYAKVRFEPRPALEDEGFERALTRQGVPIERLAAVKVVTSGRREGRAPRGLAVDLKCNAWLTERSYDARDFPLDRLLEAKTRTISAILPAKNVGDTLPSVLGAIAGLDPLIDEVLVVHPKGETVDAPNALEQPHEGKGDAMRHGLLNSTGDLIVFLDTDTEDFTDAFVRGLVGPLLLHEVDFVKGHFRRPFKAGGQGGRVTELLARPYLNVHFPQLAGFRQPLAGEIAATRAVLERIPFPAGYGVEIAMLIDVHALIGLERMAQVDLGTRQNRHQPLTDLSKMALEVLAAAERRTHGAPTTGSLLIPTEDDFEVRAPLTEEHPPLA
jgi:glycosyltransferase involved in cell wall biosynthesis